MKSPSPKSAAMCFFCVLLVTVATGGEAGRETAQWGERHTRNMVSPATGLPAVPDPDAPGLRWKADLGSQTYSSPIIAGNRVYIGTNNRHPRSASHPGDRGILYCLDTRDGSLVWQLVVPKIPDDKFKDWPEVGICSPPTVDGDRVYAVSNRGDVLCLDVNGMQDGNDGPFTDEGAFMAPPGAPPEPVDPTDADILATYSMVDEAGSYPHDSAHSSILVDGRLLYLNTGNGVDNTHRAIRAPEAPAVLALDKESWRPVARDFEGISPRTFHCTWSSPAIGTIGDRRILVFGGPDGVCYGFRALDPEATRSNGEVARLERIWRFDCDPDAPKEDVHRYVGNRTESPSTISGMPVLHDGRVYVTAGGDIWWGKREVRLHCFDASGSGDVTRTHGIWSVPLEQHSCSTPAVSDGLVFIADCAGIVRCFDAADGTPLWTHDTGGEIWGSTLVADGKLYVGNRKGYLHVLAAAREKELLHAVRLDGPIHGTPAAAESTLYVATMRTLYAFAAPR